MQEHETGININDKKFAIFCNMMVNYKHQNVLFCVGSFVELPIFYSFVNTTDIDTMISPMNIRALPNGQISLPNGQIKHVIPYGMTILSIDTTDMQAGYVRLKHDNGECFISTEPTDHGPAILRTYLVSKLPEMPSETNKEILDDIQRIFKKFPRDHVYSIHCPEWPTEADEWATRHRASGWPNQALVDKIKRFGCHFVSKPYPTGSTDKSIWRFSFSTAELLLIHSWSSNQKYIYHLLRVINRMLTMIISDRLVGTNWYWIKPNYRFPSREFKLSWIDCERLLELTVHHYSGSGPTSMVGVKRSRSMVLTHPRSLAPSVFLRAASSDRSSSRYLSLLSPM